MKPSYDKGNNPTCKRAWYRRTCRLIITLTVAVSCGLLPLAGVQAQLHVVRDTPPLEERVLPGSDWLAGHGADVFYYATHDHPAIPTRDGPYMYECIELAISLYKTLGYEQWKVNGSMIQTAADLITATLTHPAGLEDLEYYPNGDFTPPRPGDLVVWDHDYNDGTGHVGVISRVAGSEVQVVQQNMWRGDEPRPVITLDLVRDDLLRYKLTARDESSPAGWIRSPRMLQYIVESKQRPVLNSFHSQWNRDGDTLYVYLSPRLTRVLDDENQFAARSDEETGDTPLTDLAGGLDRAGALKLTDPVYVQHALRFAMFRMRDDERLSLASEVQSVDVMLKYTGDSVWLRPQGGPASGTWFRYDGLQDDYRASAW